MNTGTRAPPPPPHGAPPAYAFVTKVYRRSLRPVVIFITFLGALWTLLWGIAAFRDISVDKTVGLDVFDIILGVLYMTAFAIELLGLVAATMQKLRMIRIYAFLALGAAVVVTAAQLIRVIVHFTHKNTLISECTNSLNGDTVTTRFGFFGSETVTLDSETAQEYCTDAWDHFSFSEIAWLIVVAILSFLFASIAFSYYRQMLDPTSVANVSRAPPPQHYNPPYATGPYGYGQGPYGGAGAYAPPPGPPPVQSQPYVPQYDGAKLPDYEQGGYTGRTGDAKSDNDLKGGTDPFSDYERRTGRGSGESSRERAEDPYAVRRV